MGKTVSWQEVFNQSQGKQSDGAASSGGSGSGGSGSGGSGSGGNGGSGKGRSSGSGGSGDKGPKKRKSPFAKAEGGAQTPFDTFGGGFGNFGNFGFDTSRFKNRPTRSKKFWIIFAIIAAVVLYALYWWFHPSLSPQSGGLWAFLVIFICIPLLIIFFTLHNTYKAKGETDVAAQKKAKTFKKLYWIPIGIVAIGLVGAILSATWFPMNAHKYANVLVTTEEDFATDMQEVDYSQIPVIDRDSAVILGNRAMGTIPDYVSQFEISDLYSQINYQGTPVRVSPLGYADFFKWITNRNPGIPAYVLVDMTTQETQVVRLNEPMKYSQSEPFARNIDRYVQLKYPFYLFEQLSFEIDDEGHPWWICPVQKRTIGLFGGETISRVVLVDACTGECEDYAIEDCPQWVDRAYPSDLLIQQYNWSGLYINGWWNSWIGQAGVKQTTPGTDGQLGYNYIAKDDDVWVYTGVTSATSDNSIIGFVLINQRTGESHFYSVAGATEASAMSSAEGQVQNLRYTATFPLLLNINGQPTYFMALKDSAGLVKKYAMVDIQRYQNVAVGDTVSDCQKTYKALLATNGAITGDVDADVGDTATGTISHLAQGVVEGNSHFYITLEGDDRIYDFALPGLVEVVTYDVGDEISFTYTESDPTCIVTGLVTEDGEVVEAAPVGSDGSDAAAAGGGDAGDAAAATGDIGGGTGAVSQTTEGAALGA